MHARSTQARNRGHAKAVHHLKLVIEELEEVLEVAVANVKMKSEVKVLNMLMATMDGRTQQILGELVFDVAVYF